MTTFLAAMQVLKQLSSAIAGLCKAAVVDDHHGLMETVHRVSQ
jgi:hypothetical protein